MRYLNYLFSRLGENGTMEIGLGDWCPPGVGEWEFKTPLAVTDTILTYDIAKKAAFVYEVLKQEPQKQFALALAERVKSAFRKKLLNKETGEIKGNTQTGQAMAIYYGLLTEEERPKALKLLIKYIDDENGHSVILKINVAEKLHGKIVSPTGFTFADGTGETDLKSGEYQFISKF